LLNHDLVAPANCEVAPGKNLVAGIARQAPGIAREVAPGKNLVAGIAHEVAPPVKF
jgi:hypothetical protein